MKKSLISAFLILLVFLPLISSAENISYTNEKQLAYRTHLLEGIVSLLTIQLERMTESYEVRGKSIDATKQNELNRSLANILSLIQKSAGIDVGQFNITVVDEDDDYGSEFESLVDDIIIPSCVSLHVVMMNSLRTEGAVEAARNYRECTAREDSAIAAKYKDIPKGALDGVSFSGHRQAYHQRRNQEGGYDGSFEQWIQENMAGHREGHAGNYRNATAEQKAAFANFNPIQAICQRVTTMYSNPEIPVLTIGGDRLPMTTCPLLRSVNSSANTNDVAMSPCNAGDPNINPAGFTGVTKSWSTAFRGATYPNVGGFVFPLGAEKGGYTVIPFVPRSYDSQNLFWDKVQNHPHLNYNARTASGMFFTISPCPGDFRAPKEATAANPDVDPYLSIACREFENSAGIVYSTHIVKPRAVCTLNPGQQYYLNIIAADPSKPLSPNTNTCEKASDTGCEVQMTHRSAGIDPLDISSDPEERISIEVSGPMTISWQTKNTANVRECKLYESLYNRSAAAFEAEKNGSKTLTSASNSGLGSGSYYYTIMCRDSETDDMVKSNTVRVDR